jgi:hypothetical protein
MDDETARLMVSGVLSEAEGESQEALERRRDAMITAMQKAMRPCRAGGPGK